MRLKQLGIAILVLSALTGSFAAAQSIPLSASDEEVVKSAVADELLYPDRARFSLIRASQHVSATAQSVCGYVEAIEADGFRGPMRAFHGIIATNKFGERVFAVITLARTQTDQQVAELMCVQEGIGPHEALQRTAPQVGGPVEAPPEEIAVQIEEANALQARCRGTEGADPNSDVCEMRNDVFTMIARQGWCYGREGEAGYQAAWHVCDAGSIGAE